MTNHDSRWRCFLAAATAVALAGAVGCGEEAEEVVQTPAPKKQYVPPPPPKPEVESVASLMARLGIDDRVSLPEQYAPPTTEGRIAVLKFFNSIATGSDDALESMIGPEDATQLTALVDSGQWQESTDDVEIIMIRTGRNKLGDECALGIIETSDTIQPQMWTYRLAGGGARFDSIYTPYNIMDRINDPRMIGMWYDIMDEEIALANKPDDDFIIPQRQYDDEEEEESAPASAPSGKPSGPTGPAIPRHKPSRKRNPRRPGTSPGGG